MVIFDQFSAIYDRIYGNIKQRIVKFDSSYELWHLRAVKRAEWKYWWSQRGTIMTKDIKSDD